MCPVGSAFSEREGGGEALPEDDHSIYGRSPSTAVQGSATSVSVDRPELAGRDQGVPGYIMWDVSLAPSWTSGPDPHRGRPHSGIEPQLLVDMIAANPKTKVHPLSRRLSWIGETGPSPCATRTCGSTPVGCRPLATPWRSALSGVAGGSPVESHHVGADANPTPSGIDGPPTAKCTRHVPGGKSPSRKVLRGSLRRRRRSKNRPPHTSR